MFEKEAKEYVEPWKTSLAYITIKEAFQKGAEFGYNKANEIVLCYCLGCCGVSFPITARLYIDYNDANVKRWWTIAGEGKLEQLNNVIAWKEIVPPELKEAGNEHI